MGIGIMQVNLPGATDPNLIDPYKIAAGNNHVDPELFKMYLNASATKLDALFGSDGQDEESPIPSQAQSSFPTGFSMYEQMITRSNLIGKTVEAIDPKNNKVFSGKVTGVAVESDKLKIVVGGKNIPPENLVEIKE